MTRNPIEPGIAGRGIPALPIVLALAITMTLTFAVAGKETVYGSGVKVSQPVAIGDLLDHPETYLGKRIRVDGQITGVCPRMGCWIDIADEKGHSIRFKVKDGEIVFPMEAKGKSVAAEGVLTKLELSAEEALDHARHMAEEKGEPFDESSVEGPLTLYRIQGEGARVE
jgi:hypothetical protein